MSQTPVCILHQLTCQIANLFFMIELLHVKPLHSLLEASGERSNPFRLLNLLLLQMHAMCEYDSGKVRHTQGCLYNIRHYNALEFCSHQERLCGLCRMLPDMLFIWYIIEPLSRNGVCIMHDVVINTTLHINCRFLAEETISSVGIGE